MYQNNTFNMKTVNYEITNGCVKKPGCRNYVEEYILPHGKPQTQIPEQVKDNAPVPKGK